MTIPDTNSLQHWGIPGMRWGVRRRTDSGSSGSGPDPAKKTSGSADHETVAKIKKKKISEMSNEELRVVANRIQLEKQYRDITAKQTSFGQQLAKKALADLAGATMKTVAEKGGTELGNILLRQVGLMAKNPSVANAVAKAADVAKTIAK